MRGNKFEKSHILILESETLRRESRVTESAQEYCRFNLKMLTVDLFLPFVNTFILFLGVEVKFTRMWGFYLEGSEFRLDYWGGFWQEV